MYITHAHTTNQPSQKAPAAYEVVDSADWDPLNTIVFANYAIITPYLCIEKMKYNIVLTILHKKWHSHLQKKNYLLEKKKIMILKKIVFLRLVSPLNSVKQLEVGIFLKSCACKLPLIWGRTLTLKSPVI